MANFMDKLKIGKRELTEVERVQQNMAQIECEIQQKFVQLGAMFYRDNMDKNNLEESYGEIIGQVKKMDENRKSFYAHKLRLEGNMLCVNCGEIIPYGSVFCTKCGKHASEKEAL